MYALFLTTLFFLLIGASLQAQIPFYISEISIGTPPSEELKRKTFQFLTHDGKEISKDFLSKNKFLGEKFNIKSNTTNTFILTEKQLLILGNNKKRLLKLDLETAFPADNYNYEAYNSIVAIDSENIWFCYQNHLLHYNFKNKKLLRKVDLSHWNPHQVELDNRNIWLISKDDGKLYGLDFEPDQKSADLIAAKIEMVKKNGCIIPDPKMIEATKAAQEKLNYKK